MSDIFSTFAVTKQQMFTKNIAIDYRGQSYRIFLYGRWFLQVFWFNDGKIYDSHAQKAQIPPFWHTFQVCSTSSRQGSSTSSRQGRGHGNPDPVSWFRLLMPEAFELFIMLFKAINKSINILLCLLLTFSLPLSLPLVDYIDIKVTIYRGRHITNIRFT